MAESTDDARQLVGQFTAALQRGETADIDAFVKQAPHRQRAQVLVALIDIEARHLIARGDNVTIDTYQSRFPALADDRLKTARQFLSQKIEQYQRELRASRVGASPAGADMTVSSDGHTGPEVTHTSDGHNALTNTQDPSPTVTQVSGTPSAGASPGAGAAPRYIGKYLVIAELDRGGQATVFRAAHPQLGTEVAIKMFHSRNPQSVERLHNEGRTLASLRHPGIASVYDLDLHEGQPFVVMEYVRGRNLAQYGADENVPPARAASLIAKVARALAVAHRAGVLHLDIKPPNILIDSDGEPRLIDFGLARFRQSLGEEKEHPSRLIGTLLYMSPEQAKAQSDLLTARSDIFALGCVLFELLTGQRPYAGSTKTQVLERAKLGQITWQPLDDAKIADGLKDVCHRAMAVNPADRFNSAEEMAEQLEAATAAPARRSSMPLIVGAAGAAVVLVAVAIGVIIGALKAPAARDPGTSPSTVGTPPGNNIASGNGATNTVSPGTTAQPSNLNIPSPPPAVAQPDGLAVDSPPMAPLRVLVVSEGRVSDPRPNDPVTTSDYIRLHVGFVPAGHTGSLLLRTPTGMTRVLATIDDQTAPRELTLQASHQQIALDDASGSWVFVAVSAPKGVLDESMLLGQMRNMGAVPALASGEIVRVSSGPVDSPAGGGSVRSARTAEGRSVETTLSRLTAAMQQISSDIAISVVVLTPTNASVQQPPPQPAPTQFPGPRAQDTPPDSGDQRPPQGDGPRNGDDRRPPRPGGGPRPR